MQNTKFEQSRYEIVRPLAEGGFGQVYLAKVRGEAGFHRTVAIKRIRPELVAGPEFVSDFIKEARIGGYLQHHNVVQVLGFERLAGHYALIMDYVDGVGLERVIKRAKVLGEQIPVAVVAEMMAQAADGLHYVHSLVSPEGKALELVHRDLKPSNLLVSRAGLLKISDFGIARAAVHLGQEQTQAGIIKGTVAFFSPEQARGEPIDHRSDLYSLGGILFELLALEPLFPGKEPFAILGKVGRNLVEDRLDTLPRHAAPFMAILRKVLTSSPETRIATAAEIAEAMRRIQIRNAMPGQSLANYAAGWCDWSNEESGAADENRSTLVMQNGHEDPWLVSIKSGGGLHYGATYENQLTERGALAKQAEIPTAMVDNNATTAMTGLGQTGISQTLAMDAKAAGAAPQKKTDWPFIAVVLTALILIGAGAGYLVSRQAPLQPEPIAAIEAQPIQAVAPVVEKAPALMQTPTPVVSTPTPAVIKKQVKANPLKKRPIITKAKAAVKKKTAPPAQVASANPGTLTIGSRPSAQVFLDGKSLGETPIRKYKIEAGNHVLRLSRPDLDFAQEVKIQVKSGASVKVICHAGGCDVVAK